MRGWLIACAPTLQSIRREAPKIGGSFAVWGGLFSTFDCSFVALRKKVHFYLTPPRLVQIAIER